MRFGIFNFGMWHPSRSVGEVIHEFVDQAVLAEELGFDGYWVGEHHFSHHGVIGNGLTVAAHLAARTEHIRLGTAVIVLPLHHPIRVAEEAALVDHLSHGRLDIGVGSGYQRAEFEGLHVDINEARARFAEYLDVMIAAWTQRPFAFQGQFGSWSAEAEVEVNPTPFQKPHPPIHVAMVASPESLDLAARRGLPVLLGGPADLTGVAPQAIERWKTAMRSYGHDPSGIAIPISKGVYVAETDERAAADIAASDALWDVRLLGVIGSPISKSGDVPPGYEHYKMRQKDREKAIEERAQGGTAQLVGSPETVTQRLMELRDAGVESIFGRFGLSGMPPEKVMNSIRLFGKEVMPRLTS